MSDRKNNVSRAKNMSEIRKNKASAATKMFLEFVGEHFCLLGRKICSRKNVSRGGQTGKYRYRKYNFS